MSSSKPVPSVTDDTFGIRTPAFMVVHGHVLHWIAVQRNNEQIMSVGDSVSYRKHGSFKICCIHDGHAVIEHVTLSGVSMHLFVPNERWLNATSGSYRVYKPDYPSFVEAYRHLARPEPVVVEEVVNPKSLAERYHMLFDAFRGFWEREFAEEIQEDNDFLSSFGLGARIRYGFHCAMMEQPIPDDCRLEDLEKEVDGWIAYIDD